MWTEHFHVTTLLARTVLPAACFLPLRQGALSLEAYDILGKEGNTLNFALSSGMVEDAMRREELETPCAFILCESLEAQELEMHITREIVIHVLWVLSRC